MQAIMGVLQLPYRSLTALLRARIVTLWPCFYNVLVFLTKLSNFKRHNYTSTYKK
ncbi:uncharacterized protein BKA55DRAFT_581004 [Fusarium redolens]|uniref:Uncharacterized protein n=1 Tax=Fusarium redolens TaxID=48865 RepID=A0A9P9JPL6_FUSRE|nr:uncharacterized protein BKA55DRAFT_581004 [Fusarium redolens]KAH7232348.1 hypothetical protein BKA55DRAFT_581004 [Fusarium redolens]